MEMTLKQCRYLMILDKHRHYGRASEELGITQPALSRAVQSLEDQIGVQLFERSRSGVTPTQAGDMTIKHARRMLAVAADLESDVMKATRPEQHTLSIASGHFPAELTIPATLSALLQEWPNAQIEMAVTDWPDALARLRAEKCQLAVCELSDLDAALEPGAVLLNDCAVYPVVRRGHPLARISKPTLADLLSYPWASSQIPRRAATAFGSGPWAAGTTDNKGGHFNPRIIAASLSTALRLVAESEFVGMTPVSIALPFLQQEALEIVRFRAPWLRLNYGIVRDVRKPVTPIMSSFIQKISRAEKSAAVEEARLCREFGLD
jgi:DNA-binding transcriptional LysR family regulator